MATPSPRLELSERERRSRIAHEFEVAGVVVLFDLVPNVRIEAMEQEIPGASKLDLLDLPLNIREKSSGLPSNRAGLNLDFSKARMAAAWNASSPTDSVTTIS
ncbi:MAG: hypothetical protein OXH09_15340 [Gammaproteobacteria bacterium]|nr:hypothetical protein [Gammaproteobacteria bacterium]